MKYSVPAIPFHQIQRGILIGHALNHNNICHLAASGCKQGKTSHAGTILYFLIENQRRCHGLAVER